jgi:hypothetical protein
MPAAVAKGAPVGFWYTNRFGTYAEYKLVFPIGDFVIPANTNNAGGAYLWAFHGVHGKKEQFNKARIGKMSFFRAANIVDVLVAPSLGNDFFRGVPVWLKV